VYVFLGYFLHKYKIGWVVEVSLGGKEKRKESTFDEISEIEDATHTGRKPNTMTTSKGTDGPNLQLNFILSS
jgi:hypothetical protein